MSASADLALRFVAAVDRERASVLVHREGCDFTGGDLLASFEAKLKTYREAGVGGASRVGVVAWPPEEFITDLFALFELGALAVPILSGIKEWELSNLQRLCAMTHLLSSSAAASGEALTLADRPLERLAEERANETVAAAAQLTSGTTGSVKVAARLASSLIEECEHYREALGLCADDRIVCTLPLNHAYGFGLCALAAPLAGVRVDYASSRKPRLLLRQLSEQPGVLFPSVPPLLRLLAEASRGGFAGQGLRALSAGVPLDRGTAERVGSELHASLGQVYGTTETGPICIRPPGPARDAHTSLGPPLPGVHVGFCGRGGGDIAPAGSDPGDREVVCVRSKSTMVGYLEGDGIDDSRIQGGYFTTGDLGRWVEGGLVLTGRESSSINVAGEKVSPEEVEAVLLECPEVRNALVVAVDDPRVGQRIRALVTPETVETVVLKRLCEERLSAAKVPQFFEALPTLETTAAGKVVRNQSLPAPPERP